MTVTSMRMTLAAFAALAVSAASSASVVFNLGDLINGSTPTGTPPYLTAIFETTGTDQVKLTMTNNMPTTNFVDDWVFNMNPVVALNAVLASGNLATVTSGSDFTNGGANMKGGLFDLHFAWPTSNNDPDRFVGGETTVYTLTGTGLTENSFVSLSVPDGNNPGGYYSAAHVQGFGSSGSIGTKVVPEPASLASLALGTLAFMRRRKAR